jgi:DNA (cytosine-5)-methyltransferase 1
MSVGQSLTRQDKTRQDKTVVVGCLDGVFESTNRVYSINGISPAITTYCGGNQEAKILEVKKIDTQSLRMVRTEEGKALRKAYESGEVHHGFNEYRTAEPRNDDVSNTITTVQKDNLILEIKNQIDERYHNFIYDIDGALYLIRIRKLTPKECWRVMGFSDEDFYKAQSVNSNTQLYKQAGNSIVKNALIAIFGQMFEGKENDYKNI